MTTKTLSTAAAANIFALMLLPSPTVSPIPNTLEPQIRPAQKTTTWLVLPEIDWDHMSAQKVQTTSITPISNLIQSDEPDRPTTLSEKITGELRSWSLLSANWDGEGAVTPDARSLKEAVSFVRLLGEGDTLPEPMLHASGHAGLFWKDDNLYADIKFLGDGRVAYYIERQGDKHKGVLKFNSQKMPAVFPTLLRA
ncbi:hypothetical protein HZA56_08385 [Candidatus Poribacteria bacterium]|nr:hypothetical protein [Candidatus Poribacteria bacterium]